LQENS